MNNRDKWIYRISTGLLTALMTFSAIMYFVQYDTVSETISGLGFPTFIIYPLAIAKLLGVFALWSNKTKVLKEWAYAGFTFNLLLAFGAHFNVGDGEQYPALVGLILLAVSYYYSKKMKTT